MNRERFRFHRVIHHESDVLVGLPPTMKLPGVERCVEDELVRLRKLLLDFAKKEPRFLFSLDPLRMEAFKPGSISDEASEIDEELMTMISCGEKTGTGPMSSVAGLFARAIGRCIVESYGEMELLVENGGDLYLRNRSDLLSVIHAGRSSLSDKMAFVVPPGEWGICTSSGTMGHSFSRGRADAVSVICKSAPLADSWSTAIANRINNVADMERELETVSGIPEILACAIIVDEQIGMRGSFELKLLTTEK
jgi:uncharacterized protein